MKNIYTLLTVLLAMTFAPTAHAREFVLTDSDKSEEVAEWSVTSQQLGFKGAVPFSVIKSTLHGGKQEGSTIITIVTDALKIIVIPTRGMSLYRVNTPEIELGWKSPVEEIVHPREIALDQRGGLGWLDGFNEMLVRCGYEWSGHPGMEKGRLYSLHGRAGNTPASKVVVAIDDAAPHRIEIRGLVKEKTFKLSDLETWTSVSLVPGERTFRVRDELTNLSDYEREYQIIYHSNFGVPLLEGGARFSVAAQEVSAFNDYARKGLADWQTYLPPTKGFDEMVYNIRPYADQDGKTVALLTNQARTRGVALAYDTRTLPALTLWKNTDTLRQGYVTGIEPGSGFAYPRALERAGNRIAKLGPGGKVRFDLEYRVLTSAEAVSAQDAIISTIMAGRKTKLVDKPLARE